MSTRILGFGLLATIVLVSVQGTGPVLAQKKTDELAKAKARIAELEREVAARDLRLRAADAELRKVRGDDTNLKKDNDKLKQSADSVGKANLVHAVYYKLKDGSPEDQTKAFLDNAGKSLAKLPGVRSFWAGRPSDRSGSAASREYQVGYIAVFDNADALNTFLDNPAQKKFAEGLKSNWDPVVYDLLRE